MFILNSDQEKYHFLNVCIFCADRYARFSQAQSHLSMKDGISTNNISYKYSYTTHINAPTLVPWFKIVTLYAMKIKIYIDGTSLNTHP